MTADLSSNEGNTNLESSPFNGACGLACLFLIGLRKRFALLLNSILRKVAQLAGARAAAIKLGHVVRE